MLVRFGPNTGSKLAGMYLMIAFVAGFPISLSMISSNVAGFTKKAVASAMMFVAYCAGNIAGPFLFFASEAPVYQVRTDSEIASLHPLLSIMHLNPRLIAHIFQLIY